MNTYILIYDGFVDFEIAIAQHLFKQVGEIVTVGLTKDQVVSHGQFNVVPHIAIDEVDIEDVGAFLIPGGMPDPVIGRPEVNTLLAQLNERGTVLGAICAAPSILAAAGVLSGRQFTTTLNVNEHKYFEGGQYVEEDVVIDQNIVTAKGTAYVEFAVAVAEVLKLWKNEDQALNWCRRMKNQK